MNFKSDVYKRQEYCIAVFVRQFEKQRKVAIMGGPTWLCLPICGVTSAIYLVQQIIEEIGSIVKGGGN